MEASGPDDSAARRTQIWIAIIAAIGGIIAAAIGLVGTLLATNSSITANGSTPAPTVTKTVIVQTPGPSDKPTVATTTGAPSAEVYHQDQISLAASGRGVNFDAPPEDRTWSGSPNSEDQIWIDNTGALVMNLDVFRVRQGTEASYAYCSSGTLYAPFDNGPSTDVLQGAVFCAQSNSGRFGSIQVVKKSQQQWTLKITTWVL